MFSRCDVAKKSVWNSFWSPKTIRKFFLGYFMRLRSTEISRSKLPKNYFLAPCSILKVENMLKRHKITQWMISYLNCTKILITAKVMPILVTIFCKIVKNIPRFSQKILKFPKKVDFLVYFLTKPSKMPWYTRPQ